MKPKRTKQRKTIPVRAVESAVAISTRQLLEAGAIVLGGRFGFTDAEQAEWIEATSKLANERVTNLAGRIQATNEELRKNE